MNQPQIHYRNQKFFLQIEGGEQIEITNWEVIGITECVYGLYLNHSKLLNDDGDSFPLPSGIGYKKNGRCMDDVCGTECLYEGCAISKTVTLYVIEEEKEPQITKGILPCPFCGSPAEVKQTGKLKMKIRCTKCHIGLEQKVLRLSLEWLEENLIESWNKRVRN